MPFYLLNSILSTKFDIADRNTGSLTDEIVNSLNNKPAGTEEKTTWNDPEPKSDIEDWDKKDIKDDWQEKKYPKYVPYDRFKEVIEKKNSLLDEVNNLKTNKENIDIDPEDEEVLKQLEKYWFVKKDQLDKELKEKELKQIETQQVKEYEWYLNQLEHQYSDMWDGFPKFNKEEVLQFWMENNIYDPQASFLVKNMWEIVDYYVKQEINKQWKAPDFSANSKDIDKSKESMSKNVSFNDNSLKDKIVKMLQMK